MLFRFISMIFLFKKTFDTILLAKLKAYGLTESLHFWVSEFSFIKCNKWRTWTQ